MIGGIGGGAIIGSGTSVVVQAMYLSQSDKVIFLEGGGGAHQGRGVTIIKPVGSDHWVGEFET